MQRLNKFPLRKFALALLCGGALAVALSGCAARRQAQAAETEAAATIEAATAVVSIRSGTGAGPTAAGPTAAATSQGSDIDAQLQHMTDELNQADTINDFSTTVPPAGPTATLPPVAGSATETSQPNTPAPGAPTAAPKATAASGGSVSSSDQETQLDQEIGAMLDALNNTDTVPEAQNVK